jgi:hypothetical protein
MAAGPHQTGARYRFQFQGSGAAEVKHLRKESSTIADAASVSTLLMLSTMDRSECCCCPLANRSASACAAQWRHKQRLAAHMHIPGM